MFKVSMQQAYMVASLGTIASLTGFIVGQLLFNAKMLQLPILGWSWIYFFGISIVMYVFEPFWSPKGQKWVTIIVGPILVLVGRTSEKIGYSQADVESLSDVIGE